MSRDVGAGAGVGVGGEERGIQDEWSDERKQDKPSSVTLGILLAHPALNSLSPSLSSC